MQVALIDLLGASCNHLAMSDEDKFPSQLAERFQVRFPDGMRERIRKSAENSGRSMNSEIIQRLTRSFLDDGTDALRLDLPAHVWNAMMMDAHAHNQTTEERAADLLRGLFTEDSVFDEPTDYALALEKLSEKTMEVINLEDKVISLKENLDVDFLLYWNKTAQLRNLIDFILSDKDSVLSDRLKSAASDMEKLIKAEVSLFEDRQKGANWHRARKAEAEADKREEDIYLEDIISSKQIRDLDKKPKS